MNLFPKRAWSGGTGAIYGDQFREYAEEGAMESISDALVKSVKLPDALSKTAPDTFSSAAMPRVLLSTKPAELLNIRTDESEVPLELCTVNPDSRLPPEEMSLIRVAFEP